MKIVKLPRLLRWNDMKPRADICPSKETSKEEDTMSSLSSFIILRNYHCSKPKRKKAQVK